MTAMMSGVTPMEELGQKVARARAAQGYGVKAAAEEAGVARETWKRVENGEGVHDTSRAKVLALLGLDHHGDPLPVQPATPDRDGLLDTYSDDELLEELRHRLSRSAAAARPTLTSVPEAARTVGRPPGNPAVRQADLDAEAGDPPGPEEGA